MTGEPDLTSIMGRIRADAPSWRVEFDDRSNTHTVWADYPDRMRFCGHAGTFEAAWQLASELRGVTRERFIVSVEPHHFSILRFDANMISESRRFPMEY